MRDRDDWRMRAACRDEDPEVFFPLADPKSPLYAAQAADAKRVCRGCPVSAQCLQYALGARLGHGVFGGLDEHERAAMLRRQPQPA